MEKFNIILDKFSKEKILFCFGYGSGVIQQKGISMENKMIDLIFVVEDSFEFHKENLKLNSNHYSFLKHFGLNTILYFQKNYGGKIYYNTLIKIDNFEIKYGIIDFKDFERDLMEWETFYLAGRLQKPIKILIPNEKVEKLIKINLERAKTFVVKEFDPKTEKELYEKITSLSYNGDIRMGVAEDKNKIENIVQGNLQGFQELYKNVEIKTEYKFPNNLKEIVKKSSLEQSIKGLFTAGIRKSFKYVLRKLKL